MEACASCGAACECSRAKWSCTLPAAAAVHPTTWCCPPRSLDEDDRVEDGTHRGRLDGVRWARTVRRTLARTGQPRRMGIPAHSGSDRNGAIARSRHACDCGLPTACVAAL